MCRVAHTRKALHPTVVPDFASGSDNLNTLEQVAGFVLDDLRMHAAGIELLRLGLIGGAMLAAAGGQQESRAARDCYY